MAKKKTEATEATEAAAGSGAQRQEIIAAAGLVPVRLLVSRAGIGFSQNRGDVIEVSEGEAESIIAAGQAERG